MFDTLIKRWNKELSEKKLAWVICFDLIIMTMFKYKGTRLRKNL